MTLLGTLWLLVGSPPAEGNGLPLDAARPNFVIIMADDLGYGDLGCFGSKSIQTPHLDRMAAEGIRLTSFYVAAAVCSPSRAALLTGSYPKRVGITKVLFPQDSLGLHDGERTLPEILKERGYATACIGKWHLGHHAHFLPTRHGFDFYFGLPYSNDMDPPNPARKYPPLPLLRNETVIEEDPDQDLLTRRYTEEAVRFVRDHRRQPFFLYLPHTMPHRPIHATRDFARGIPDSRWKEIRPDKKATRDFLLSAAVAEIDWSTGEILKAIRELDLDENTMVVFTSDNGPAAGSAGLLRGRKASTWEGGMRVPGIARWPGKIESGAESAALTTTMDLLPTLARLAGAAIPTDRTLDGKDIWLVLSGSSHEKSPHEAFYYYRGDMLSAVRAGPWKLHVSSASGKKETFRGLFNLEEDLSERVDLAGRYPEVVARLETLLASAREDIGDGRHGGRNARPAAHIQSRGEQ